MVQDKQQRSPRDYFYGEILRLPPGTKGKPDYYTLLGVPFFESDHDEIVRAALERIRLLETCLADPRPPFRKTCEVLLTRVKRAQLTLLDRKKRKVYDAKLIGRDADEEEEAAEDDAEIELPTGTMFAGRYRILGEARRGGLGVVYDALDSNMRSRAHVSALRPRLSRDRFGRRGIERAARDAAGLDHPGILRVDEAGDADGLLFIRTRAPEGRNVVELIEATPRMRLPAHEAGPIIASVAEALAHAHKLGVVHGAIRPTNVLVDVNGRVLVADFCVVRAVADAGGGAGSSPYQAPEEEATPAGDLFSLGAVAYQMLAGMPPFKVRGAKATTHPLPDDVPEDLEVLVMRMLAREPDQRLADASEIAQRLAAPSARRRLPVLVGIAAVLVVALVAALVGRGTEETTEAAPSLSGEAWRLIANREYDEAIEKLRAGLVQDPDDGSIQAALARALTGKAALLEKGGELWDAQLLLTEAIALEPVPERSGALARVKDAAEAVLGALPVEIEPVSARPLMHFRIGDVPVETIDVDGVAAPPPYEVAFDDLPEGPHTVPFTIVDRAGNRRDGEIPFVVDRTPPRLVIVAPEEGALLKNGSIVVRVRVLDANPPAAVTIRGRKVPLANGEGESRFDLGDGTHDFDVEVTDRAGHTVRARRAVVVDSKAPDLVLEAKRVAVPGSAVPVRGRVSTPGARVEVDGVPVQLAADGSFEHSVEVTGDRFVVVEAVGATGIRKKLSVQVVLDPDPPSVSVRWERRAGDGRLLYGGPEMDAGAFALPLLAEDKTGVRWEPSEGEVEKGTWRLAPHEGARRVAVAAVDEAGNRAELSLSIEGHRATPALTVKNATRDITTDEEAVLEIETDADLLVQGAPAEPGRVRVPLPEGEVALLVQALDPYGNETRWSRTVIADRTAPRIRLAGDPERGIGRQGLEIRADETLASVTCAGKTFEVNSDVAHVVVDLQLGRRRLHVVARDLAGNVAREKFVIEVKNRVLALDGRSALSVPLVLPGEEFTVECWVKGVEAAARSVLFSCSYGSDCSVVWSSADKSLPYAALVLSGAGTVSMPAKRAWKWSDWTHLALSVDGKKGRFYVDGSLQASADLNARIRQGKPEFYVGGEKTSRGRLASLFKGSIDELRVSSVARYTRGFTPPRFHKEDEHTVLLLRFDVKDGESFPDSSGKNHHASALGKPALADADR